MSHLSQQTSKPVYYIVDCQILYQLMGVFCDRLKLHSTAAPDCWTGQNKGRYPEEERSFLLVSLAKAMHKMAEVIQLLGI